MNTRPAGLVIFVNPSTDATVAPLLRAVHQDHVENLAGRDDLVLYLASSSERGASYAAQLAEPRGLTVIQVPDGAPPQRWDAGLCVLFNRHGHRKILVAEGHVPEIYPEDLVRVIRKLELYDLVVGREGEDRCWLVGMNGHRPVLERAETRPEDLLHPILHAASQAALHVSVLDTRQALTGPQDVLRLRHLAATDRHRHLALALAEADRTAARPGT